MEVLGALVLAGVVSATLGWLWVDGWERAGDAAKMAFWYVLGVTVLLVAGVAACGAGGFAVCFLVAAGIWGSVTILVLWLSRPLTTAEVHRVAGKLRQRDLSDYFRCGSSPVHPDPQFKSGLEPNGALYPSNMPMQSFPSFAAHLLKYKKHEWMVIGFARDCFVTHLWAHKGPDSTQVSVGFSPAELAETAGRLGAEVVLWFHNHPATDPQHYSYNMPSGSDLTHAAEFGAHLVAHGISLANYVCERGVAYPYTGGAGLYCADSLLPLQAHVAWVAARTRDRSYCALRMRLHVTWG